MTNDELLARIAALEDALYLALPFVEDHEDSDTYKPGAVKKAIRVIRAALREEQ